MILLAFPLNRARTDRQQPNAITFLSITKKTQSRQAVDVNPLVTLHNRIAIAIAIAIATPASHQQSNPPSPRQPSRDRQRLSI
jgi:hypothetical protein